MADEWTEEQRREFVIKDNVGFGESWRVWSRVGEGEVYWSCCAVGEAGCDVRGKDDMFKLKDNKWESLIYQQIIFIVQHALMGG